MINIGKSYFYLGFIRKWIRIFMSIQKWTPVNIGLYVVTLHFNVGFRPFNIYLLCLKILVFYFQTKILGEISQKTSKLLSILRR
jgi:hypothetical protein